MLVNFFIQPETNLFSTQSGREGHVIGYVYSAKALEYNITLNEFKTQEKTATFSYSEDFFTKLQSCNKMWIPELNNMGFWILNISRRPKNNEIEITFVEPNHPMNSILSASVFSWKIPQDIFASDSSISPENDTYNEKDWIPGFGSKNPARFLKDVFDWQFDLLPKLRYDLQFNISGLYNDTIFNALFENWTADIPDNFGGYDFQELLTYFKKKFYLHGFFTFDFWPDFNSISQDHFGRNNYGNTIVPGTLKMIYDLKPYDLNVEDVYDMENSFTLIEEKIDYPSVDDGVALINIPFEKGTPYFHSGEEKYEGNSYFENNITTVVVKDSKDQNKNIAMSEIMKKFTYHNISARNDQITTLTQTKHNNYWIDNSQKFVKTTSDNFKFRNPSMKTHFIALDRKSLNWDTTTLSPDQWLSIMMNKSNTVKVVETKYFDEKHLGKFILIYDGESSKYTIKPITEMSLNEKNTRFTLGTNNDFVLHTKLPGAFQSDLKQSE